MYFQTVVSNTLAITKSNPAKFGSGWILGTRYIEIHYLVADLYPSITSLTELRKFCNIISLTFSEIVAVVHIMIIISHYSHLMAWRKYSTPCWYKRRASS